MRRILLLCLIIVAASLSWPASAARSEDCTTYCTYLPLIRYPSPIQVHDENWRGDHHGVSHRCGLIVNRLPETISDVRLEFQAFDLQHQLVMTATGSPNLPVTMPGGLNAFCIQVKAEPGFIPPPEYTYVVEVQDLSTDGHGKRYAPISVVDMQEGDPKLDTEVSGTLRNDTQGTLRTIEITAWLYWDWYSGNPPRLLAVNIVRYIEKTELAPGETTTFRVRFDSRPEFPPPPPITVIAVGEVVQP